MTSRSEDERKTTLRQQRDRAEKKAAAANIENEALRRDIRALRLANFILQRNLEGQQSAGYKQRFEKLTETIGLIRELARADVNGLPESFPSTLEPWVPPSWAEREVKR